MSLLSNAIAIPQKGGYNFTDSVRFRESAGAYLSKTFSSAGNRKTWTYSVWLKRGSNTGNAKHNLFGTIDLSVANRQAYLAFNETGSPNYSLMFVDYTAGTYNANVITNQVFRDHSAWYHVVVQFDTTQATASDRVKIYINGERVTSFNTATYPSLNYDGWLNGDAGTGVNMGIGRVYPYASNEEFDGYMTEINFVDGQALTASDFGEYDDTTGVWKPKRYTGTYGTNGFYLKMSPTLTYSADYLVVGGGGAGGTSGTPTATGRGGGGGAGGFLTGSTNLQVGTTYNVVVGSGGSGTTYASDGSSSSISAASVTAITALGGGAGGATAAGRNGRSGGSGGGGGTNAGSGTGGAGTSGQGNNGGNGLEAAPNYGAGGGGGAGAVGSNGTATNGGNGGNGTASSITGTSVTYAGGGGGATFATSSGTQGSGGSGGGGAGGWRAAGGTGIAGTANTGGGGGGGSDLSFAGNGGSGVVILRMLTTDYTGTTTGSPTVTTDGSYTVVKFTGNGSYTA
jgi:hypothetical protein